MMSKEDLLESYLRESIRNSEERFRRQVYLSPEVKLPERGDMDKISQLINDFRAGKRSLRWMVLPGLRGVGKTTLLAQVYTRLIRDMIPKERVLYLSIDDLKNRVGSSLAQALSAYEEMIGSSLESLKNETFFLVDEAHFDPDWGLTLKGVYDRSDQVFILVTGSSALGLGETADTARRALTKMVLPLTLREYLDLSADVRMPVGLPEEMGRVLFASPDYQELRKGLTGLRSQMNTMVLNMPSYALERYLRVGSMPFSLGMEEHHAMQMIHSTVDRVVEKDLPAYRAMDRSTLIKASNLISYLAFGDRINLQSLSTNLDTNKVTVSQVLEGLERADILYRIHPHGPESTRHRSTPLFRFTSPAMRAAVLWKLGRLNLDRADYGLLLEDATVQVLRKAMEGRHLVRFDFDQHPSSADFVLSRGDQSRIALELGSGKKDAGQVKNTMSRTNCAYGLIAHQGELRFVDESQVAFVPKEWLLLSC